MNGVSTYLKTLMAVKDWPIPTNVKKLRGFMGLTGYYRRFVKGYRTISKPLTELLKKDAFVWNPQAKAAFDKLKEAMISAPTLALPDFEKPFVLETDARFTGISAVLMHDNHPIAFVSKALANKHLSLSAYDKELMFIVHAVERWRHYLIGRHFTIKTDHQSLKYLIKQRLHNDIHFCWLSKLWGMTTRSATRRGEIMW